ncbi:MAG TPA: hypothetical protein VLS45_04780, partial [Methylomicrobium sp.]|nr:hypothetical protein [Methylomicrobium sp.]
DPALQADPNRLPGARSSLHTPFRFFLASSGISINVVGSRARKIERPALTAKFLQSHICPK